MVSIVVFQNHNGRAGLGCHLTFREVTRYPQKSAYMVMRLEKMESKSGSGAGRGCVEKLCSQQEAWDSAERPQSLQSTNIAT